MLHIQTTGTAGDAWVSALKISSLSDPVILHHTIDPKHSYWADLVDQILRLAPNVKDVLFSDEIDPSLPRVRSQCYTHLDQVDGIEMRFYERLLDPVKIDRSDVPAPPYGVVQCHAGKPPGRGVNTKLLTHSLILRIIEHSAIPVVLIGTEESYKAIDTPFNRSCEWDILKTMKVVAEANGLVAPDGLMAFVAAASCLKISSYFGDIGAIEGYVANTPWERQFEIQFIPPEQFQPCNGGLAAVIDGPLPTWLQKEG